MADYWIRASGKIHGPFNSRELKELIAKGKLKTSHEVSPDQQRWKLAGEVNGLTFPVSMTSAIPVTVESATQASEAGDVESGQATVPVTRKQRLSWLEVRHFLAANRIPVAIALLLCLAAVHYLVISPWLYFSKVLSAAEEGNVPAQMEVALLYETGSGTWRSYPDALKWYATAAENGNMNAMFLIYGSVAAERTGSEEQIVLVLTGGRDLRREIAAKDLMEKNPLIGLVTMLAQAHQNGDADKPMTKDNADKFNRMSETTECIREFEADPLASAFLTKQAADGSAIAAMQLANVARINRVESETATTNTVNAELLSFLSDASNASGFLPDSAGPHAFKVLSDIAAQIGQTDGQE